MDFRPAARAVLLDFDGTLIDNSIVPATITRTCEVIATAVPGLDPRKLLAANADAWNTSWPDAEQRCWIGEVDVHDVSREVWRSALQTCGCDDAGVADMAFETLRRIDREMAQLFDDVVDFLRALGEARMPMALVTNSSKRSQMERLESVGLASAFTAVVISGDIGVAKPDPAIFRAALGHLELDASDVVHIGDSLTTDIAGARGAGIASIWLNRSGRPRADTDPAPDLEVTSLRDVLPVLLP